MYIYTYIYLQVGKVCGTTYKQPCVVVLGIDDEFPVFGKITSVYIINEVIVFSVLLLYTYLVVFIDKGVLVSSVCLCLSVLVFAFWW